MEIIGILILIFATIMYILIESLEKVRIDKENSKYLQFMQGSQQLPPIETVEYIRDIPCNGSILRAFWLGCQYGIIQDKTDLIGTYLLKWIKEEKIKVVKLNESMLNFMQNEYAIDLNGMEQPDNVVENELLLMLLNASKKNKILENREFIKWAKNNYSRLLNWFQLAINYETQIMIEDGSIEVVTKEKNILFGLYKYKLEYKCVPDNLRKEAIKLLGLKKFLLEYSLISQKEFLQINIWEDYLLFAQILGIASKIEEQIGILYPNYDMLVQICQEIGGER